jgi:23S rRNA (guanosine2251-2'-O)-methyltransferase
MAEGKALRKKKQVRELMRDFAAEHGPSVEVTFLLQDWTDAYNVGGLLRVADALGVTKVYCSGKTPQLPNPMIPVTSMGAHRRVEMEWRKVHEEAAKAAQEDGWTLVAVEIAEGAETYFEFNYPPKTCLVLGAEGAGVFPSVLRRCEGSVYIPMQGKGRSLNVHVSGAVVAFHAKAQAWNQSGQEKSGTT